jgi:hypothetical protein
MQTFKTIKSNDYTVEELYVSSPISWELVSGSTGVQVTSPQELEGAVSVQVASNDPTDFYTSAAPKINQDTGTYEYVLYSSINHLFYKNNIFNVNGKILTSSVAGLADSSYVISIGQSFYGNRIKPGSFSLYTELTNKYIFDDSYGNLYVSESGTGSYVGNIFYERGVAVVKNNSASIATSVSSSGLHLVSGSYLYVDYHSDVKIHRHEINVNVEPTDFNFSAFNPSIFYTIQNTGSFSGSMVTSNIRPSGSTSNTWNLYNLMGAGVIKPYITTIGLYNSSYELLAVAKLSEPIQRTFDVNQIFIIRFDT